jgi:hypothetical protein
MYEKICLMVPSYKRIDQLFAFINSALKTADDPDRIVFSFCINENDQESYDLITEQFFPSGTDQYEILLEDSQQPNLPMYFNMMYEKSKFAKEDILVSMVGDDMIFMSRGWESRIIDLANKTDGNCLIYCNDDYIAQEKLCVNLFTTRKVVDATNKPFMCKKFHADMIDVVWMLVGKMTGTLYYLPDVIIKHNHGSKLPPDMRDSTYQRMEPVRHAANSKDNQKYAQVYSIIAAANMIDNGVGMWNEVG